MMVLVILAAPGRLRTRRSRDDAILHLVRPLEDKEVREEKTSSGEAVKTHKGVREDKTSKRQADETPQQQPTKHAKLYMWPILGCVKKGILNSPVVPSRVGRRQLLNAKQKKKTERKQQEQGKIKQTKKQTSTKTLAFCLIQAILLKMPHGGAPRTQKLRAPLLPRTQSYGSE